VTETWLAIAVEEVSLVAEVAEATMMATSKNVARPIEPGQSAMMAGMAAGAARMAEAKAKRQREQKA
jgi:hypothetical protein